MFFILENGKPILINLIFRKNRFIPIFFGLKNKKIYITFYKNYLQRANWIMSASKVVAFVFFRDSFRILTIADVCMSM